MKIKIRREAPNFDDAYTLIPSHGLGKRNRKGVKHWDSFDLDVRSLVTYAYDYITRVRAKNGPHASYKVQDNQLQHRPLNCPDRRTPSLLYLTAR